MGRYIKHTSCPKCGSSDGNAVYENNSTYCFVCTASTRGDGNSYQREELTGRIGLDDISKLPVAALTDRGISEEVSKQYGVRVEYSQETGQQMKYYFPLYNQKGGLLGYQVRELPKQIKRTPDTGGALPFGSQVAGTGGKFLIVVEGAEDCMAVTQMLAVKGKAYRVVATLGTEGWKRNIEYFKSFEKVVICFDKDAAGQQAAKEFACALGSKKAFLMSWNSDAKDPNDLLREKGGADCFLNGLFKAEAYRPDGIITGEEVWLRMQNYTKPKFIPYPPEWTLMNERMEGMREGEISLWCAGTSVGKTSYIRRLKQHVLTNTDNVIGEVELEESPEKTWRGLMQFHGRMPLSQMTPEYKRQVYEETYGTQRIFTVDHRNQFTRGQSLIGKFEYLHYSMGAQVIFLDHITLAVSEFGDGGGLADQDRMMNEFLEFVEKTKAHLCIISHLRKAPSGGKGFEQGAVPSEDDLKGSGSLKQIAFDIIGVSRNKQHPDEYIKNVSQLHVLKCRETGDTGMADALYWDRQSMSLVPAELPEDPDDGEL